MKENDLLYYNEYGGFSQDGKEYVIKTSYDVTPLPWSHVIANENFGTIITANGGGYIWHKNSQANKITAWSNDSLRDTPSEKMILKIGDKEIDVLPYNSLENFEVYFGFGYAKFIYEDDDIKLETNVYVPLDREKKVYKINLESKKDTISGGLKYKLIPVLGVAREFTKKHIVIEDKKEYICIKNRYRDLYSDENIYIKTSEGYENCGFEDVEVSFNINFANKKNQNFQIEISAENNELQDSNEDLDKIKNYWNDKMKHVKVYTPVESMNIMMNGWLLYQTLVCRMWARTSFYQAGGAFGFRDQLQDSLMLLWFDEKITRDQILYHARHQFEEGDVLHWWHPEKNNGTRTRYTDDLLWLPYLVAKYVEFTGDIEILDEEVPFVKCDVLRDGEIERYTETMETDYTASLYNHAKKAIEYGVKLASNGIPQMGNGDWNDGMNKIGGQSIWLGFFIYEVLRKFIKVCEIKEDSEEIKKYEGILEILRISLNEKGWDGKWFRRAYFENGEPCGSSISDECKIDSISQSWAVISGAGEIDKCTQAMESLETYLVDRENMVIKLLTPPFDKTILNPGYIKEYIPGVRENGGQYTHGAIWSVIANAMLKNGDRAGEYFRILNPIEHARTKESVLKYKVEPYVVAADVYSNSGMNGRGGWTWYTGSSSWFYVSGFEYILGIIRQGDILKINPCIPHAWSEYNVEYVYKNTKYKIEVKNPNAKSTGITSISLDNNFIKTNEIKLENDMREHKIEIII